MSHTHKTFLLFACAALIFLRWGNWLSLEMVRSYAAEAFTEDSVIGGPSPLEVQLKELKESIEEVYQEQSILALTEQTIRQQLTSLNQQVQAEGQWSEEVQTRIYKSKTELGNIMLRKQEAQFHFKERYRFYLKLGGQPLPIYGAKYLRDDQKTLEDGEILIWPVAPERGISAYYQDPRYLRKFGFVHKAIDIPTPQLTVIRAAADGVVKRVHDAGYGYSTLRLEHNEYITLYGHIAEFLVAEGDIVRQGDPIALSGGKRGTRGAGKVTTGAHLHLEVIVKSKNKNPMDYLPPYR